MSKVEQGRHPRCRHLATRLKLHPEPTNDSSRTLPPFPHPLSYTLFPTLPYPTLPYSIFPLRLCVLAPLRSILPFASLRLCVFAFNSSLCVFAFNSFPLRPCG